MIIYGWRGKVSPAKPIEVGSCPKCSKGPLKSFTVFRYFHIYWIPLFPYSSKLWLSCDNCQATQEVDGKSPESTIPGLALQKDKPPLYLFAGLMIAALIGVFATYSHFQSQSQYKALLSEPQVGDLLVVKLEKSNDPKANFGVVRLTSVDSQSVHFVRSNYAFGSATTALSEKALKLLASEDGFLDQDMSYRRDQLLPLLDEGKIDAAVRDARFAVRTASLPSSPLPPGVKVNVE